MTRPHVRRVGVPAVLAVAAVLLAVPGGPTAKGEESRYEGVFEVKVNGDVHADMKLTLPMAKYQMMRDSISNLYLLLRNLSSSRADTEVVDKKAEWDDAERTIHFTMTWLGAAKNLGKGWQIEVPKGTTFSNLDEGKKTLFFFANATSQLGKTSGMEKLVLPPEAENPKWDNDKRIVSYEIPVAAPVVAKSGGGTGVWWILAGVCLVLGVVLVLASFVVKPASATTS